MSLVFLLGYVGIVFENLFEFNKAAIALLMSTALWVIYAGNALNCLLLMPQRLGLCVLRRTYRQNYETLFVSHFRLFH
jgi:hypothetical protein